MKENNNKKTIQRTKIINGLINRFASDASTYLVTSNHFFASSVQSTQKAIIIAISIHTIQLIPQNNILLKPLKPIKAVIRIIEKNTTKGTQEGINNMFVGIII